MDNKFIIWAHRGVSSLCPENTMAAFRKAVEAGAHGIELDVQLTRDGEVIICHDEKVDRTTNGKGYIKDYTYEELSMLDAGSWFSEEFKGERLPKLEELLDFLKDTDMLINIEIKAGTVIYKGIEENVLELIKKYNCMDRIVISCFNHYSLYKIKGLESGIKTGMLYGSKLFKPYNYAREVKVESLHPALHAIDERLIPEITAKGYKIYPYIGREVFDMEFGIRIVNSGISGIITDYPHEYLKLI